MLDARLIVEAQSLECIYEEWDALSAACGLPLMAPGWLLAWWRHIAPTNALLRVVEVRDRGELAGLAPFYVEPPKHGRRIDYRPLGIGLAAPLAPLSAPGREVQVAEAIGRTLSEADPHPDLIALHGAPLASRWHMTMRDRWPGRVKPVCSVYRTRPYPTVSLAGVSLEGWLARRSSHFRSAMRRLRRRFEEEGGTWRLSSKATLGRDIDTLQRLHAARWRESSESTLVAHGPRVTAMLNDAGHTLIDDGRFRLWMMEIDGQAIGADVYLAAGGVVIGMNGGWDERWRRLSPPLQATMRTIEDSIERGELRVDLGPGGETHKTRFADDDWPVAWSVLLTPGRRLPQTFALTAPMLAGNAAGNLAKRVLRPEHVHVLRELRRRARRSPLPVSEPPRSH